MNKVAQTFPQRIPLKIIGRGAEMDPAGMAGLIAEYLGPQEEGGRVPAVNQKGAYTSYTFWVILEREGQEASLRTALHQLPGVVMQL